MMRRKFLMVLVICIMLMFSGDQSKPSGQIKGSYEYYERVAKEYYAEYKKDLFCSEEEFVNTFMKIISEGGTEEDGRLWSFLLNMKIIRNRIID